MEEGAAMVAIISVMGGFGTFCFLIHSIKSAIVGRGRKTDQEILTEVQALRAEIQELKRQNNELFLALDDQTAHRRLGHNQEPERISQYVSRQ